MTGGPRLPRTAILGALVTAFALVGGLLAGAVAGTLMHGALPGHMAEATKIGLAALPALIGVLAGGAVWGIAMGRITGSDNASRMAWAGALGYGPTVILVGIGLSSLEVIIVERGGGLDLPIHVAFTLLFVPAAFIIAGVGGLALGLAHKNWALAGRTAFFSGLAGAVAFLGANLLMDALGWRVGAPGAAERATMLTVMFAGNLAAALAGGAAVGVVLSRFGRKPTVDPAKW